MIEVNNLKFRYKNNLPFILDSLSFCVNDGEIMSILGKNGVGKTTLLRCLISDLSDYSGTILIEGQDARTIKAVELSKKIAVVASNSICYQNLSVGDYLVTGMANRLASLHTPSKELYEEAYEILLELG